MKNVYAYLLAINLIAGSIFADLTPEQQEQLNQIIAQAKECKENAPGESAVSIVNQENYEQAVVQSEKPVIILVSAAWCPPCQIFKWIYDKVASDFKDAFTFVKIDYDSFPEFVQEQEIQGVPMLLVSKQGKITDKGPAFMPKDSFVNLLNELKK
jgi:thioredoxin 1